MWWFWCSLTAITWGFGVLALATAGRLGYPAWPSLLVLAAVASIPTAGAQHIGGTIPAVLGWATAVCAVSALATYGLAVPHLTTWALWGVSVLGGAVFIVGPLRGRRSEPDIR